MDTQARNDSEADAATLRLNVHLMHVEYPPIPLEHWRAVEAAHNALTQVPGLRGKQ